jgi:hypothetical protein
VIGSFEVGIWHIVDARIYVVLKAAPSVKLFSLQPGSAIECVYVVLEVYRVQSNSALLIIHVRRRHDSGT